MDKPANLSQQRLMKALITRSTTSLLHGAMQALSDVQGELNRLRRMAKLYDELGFDDDTGPALVFDQETAKKAEACVWDAMEELGRACEPDEELLNEMQAGGEIDDQTRHHLEAAFLDGRAELASLKAKALSLDDDDNGHPRIQTDEEPDAS